MSRFTAAAVGVPLATLVLAGWVNWRQIEDEAFRRISRTSQALSEHAQRTFRTHEVIIASVDRHIAGWSWERILASEELNGQLRRLATGAPDVASVFVMHPDGRRFNSSRRFPMPAIDSSDRDYYRALRERDTTHVSEPSFGRLSSDRFFSIARRRSGPRFDGVIAVSVSPAYFEAFYAGLVETPGDSVALVRADGVVLARHPAAEAGSRVDPAPFVRHPAGDSLRLRSRIDGTGRLVAFRPVGDYGVFASFGLSRGAVWAAWWRAMIPYAGAALLAALALVYAARRREREQADLAKRAEEQRLQRWTDAVPALVAYIDRDLRYRFNNRAYEAWFGRCPEEMRGKHVAEVLGKGAYEKLREHLESALAGRAVTYETLAPYRDGGARHIHASYIPDLAADGVVQGIFVLVLDISARRKAELALAESDRAKDEFLATLAHELRNPLAPISSALEVIRRAAPGSASARQAREIAERQTAHLARLVDDLLDASRITRGRMELRKDRVALASVVSAAVETCRPHVDGAGHRLEVCLPGEPLWVEADPVRLVQALCNLLSNAAKYTPRGGRIELSVARRGEAVEIRVRDNGIGIAPDMLPKVFDLFVRADNSLERSHGGLGIGLTLAGRIAELHNGTLAASSDGPGQGSEFKLCLPLAAAPAAAAQIRAAETPPAPGRRVLVVDDNRDGAESLAALLQLAGNEVRLAHDGEEAVQRAAAWKPDVVLLDLGLPRMNGYDVCRALRAGDGARALRIIAVTGWGQELDRQRSAAAGFDAHLVKPVDFMHLAAVLDDSAQSKASAR